MYVVILLIVDEYYYYYICMWTCKYGVKQKTKAALVCTVRIVCMFQVIVCNFQSVVYIQNTFDSYVFTEYIQHLCVYRVHSTVMRLQNTFDSYAFIEYIRQLLCVYRIHSTVMRLRNDLHLDWLTARASGWQGSKRGEDMGELRWGERHT